MDIRAWVNDTEKQLRMGDTAMRRLAEALARLPGEVTRDDHAAADATAAEAIALADAADLPWVQLYLRHWQLVSRVARRSEGRTALADARSLVERAARDDAKGCPQAICAVRDLCAALGRADGPGYAAERAATSRAALDRIDPSWPCFECLSGEHANALVDRGRPADAIAFLDAQVDAASEAGQTSATARFGVLARANALIELQMADEALGLLSQADKLGLSARDAATAALLRAQSLAILGDIDAAAADLPGPAAIVDHPARYRAWVDAVARVVRADPTANDSGLGAFVGGLVDRLVALGDDRDAIELAEVHGRLALGRGAHHTARRALAIMERAQALLPVPLDAPLRIQRLRDAIAEVPVPEVELPDDPADVLAVLSADDRPHPEIAVVIAEAACARWPDDAALVESLAVALHACRDDDAAFGALRAFVDRRPRDAKALLALGQFYRLLDDQPAMQAIADRLAASADPTLSDWLLAQWHTDHHDDDKAIAHLAAILHETPDALNTRRLWATLAARGGDWNTALLRLDEIVARDPSGMPDHWNRLVAASIVGRWDAVRDSARAIGLPDDGGTGPYLLDGGACRIHYEDNAVLFARRTGPVTAMIVEIGRPGTILRYGDRVVFDPRPENEVPAGDDADVIFVYRHVHTGERGGAQAFSLDGVHPGDRAWAELRQIVEEHGGVLQLTSGEAYRLVNPRSHDETRAIFARIATRGDVRPLHEALLAWRGDRVLIWSELAEAAGDQAAVDLFAAVATAWGITS